MSTSFRAALVALLVLASSPVAAQDGLLLGGRFVSAARNFGQDLGQGPDITATFAGGRFAAIMRYSPISGQVESVLVVDGSTGAPLYGPTTWPVVALDEARPRLFERRPTGLWSVNVVTGAATLLLARTDVSTCGFAYSADVLVCGTPQTDGRTDVLVIDASTGASRLAAVIDAYVSPGPFGGPGAWLVTPDGQRLYFALAATPSPLLAVLDLATGVTSNTAPLNGDLYWDELNERMIQTGFWTRVYTADLSLLAAVDFDFASRLCAVRVSAHTGRMYLYFWNDYLRMSFESLAVVDSTTFAPIASSGQTWDANRNKCGEMTVFTAPGVPRAVRAIISGRSVALDWTNVGAASHFVLDVGFGPGRTDASVFLGPDSHATFANVPSGTYYLRLRGGNEFGGGRPSQEIRVLVP